MMSFDEPIDYPQAGTNPIDPGAFQSDLNLIEPGVLPEGMPTPVQSPASSPANTAMLASMGLSAVGSIVTGLESAAATKAQGAYESSIANTNAAIAGVQAKQALETGDILASRKELETEGKIGQERAAQGASGVDIASGSSALVREATKLSGGIDELTIRNNAARQAWGYQTEAIQSTYQGQFASLTAAAKSQQSLLTAGLGAVSGPLAIESNYLMWQRRMGGLGGPGGLPFPERNAS